jgi:hypothetical protein
MTTDDDARARALELNRELSKAMEEAQRHGPPAPKSDSQAALRPHEDEKRRETTGTDEQSE